MVKFSGRRRSITAQKEARIKSENKQRVNKILQSANSVSTEIKFEHLKDDTYSFGSKQVTLMKKTSGIYARTGGGFIPLSEFVKINQKIEKRKINK